VIVERIGAAERNADARHAAKHAETALRRMGPSAATGERPSNRDQRRFEVMLVRRIVSGCHTGEAGTACSPTGGMPWEGREQREPSQGTA
jgi:hypothetical protein